MRCDETHHSEANQGIIAESALVFCREEAGDKSGEESVYWGLESFEL